MLFVCFDCYGGKAKINFDILKQNHCYGLAAPTCIRLISWCSSLERIKYMAQLHVYKLIPETQLCLYIVKIVAFMK